MISRRTIDNVMETARIEEVVGDFVVLKRRGSNLLGLCPFHNEKTPSFNVSPARGIFKCFGCGQAGNSVRFVMEHEKLSYPEAIRYLAKKYHIELEEEGTSDEVKQEMLERESLLLVNQWAATYFAEQLWETENGQAVALSYFRERGFSDETIRKFQLGFHPDAWSVFTDAATQAGYNIAYLIKTGLTIEKEGRHFDRFRNRVMFPIHNLSGKVIGFGGRILSNDKKQAKYLNSPESEVYHKSAVLYGIHLARKAMMAHDACLLVEGYTDVISLHQAGIENVVASSGTSLTTEQVRVIQRYTKNVTILYDGDPAGIKASFRGIDMILEQGMNVKIVLFPDGEDPDSFARSNSPLFVSEFIRSEARDFIAFKTAILQEEAQGDPIKTAEMIREIIHSLALVPDPILRSLYVKECASRLDMNEQTLINELNRQVRGNRQKKEKAESRQEAEDLPPEDLFTDDTAAGKRDALPEEYAAQAQEADLVRILIRYANEEIAFQGMNQDNRPVDIRMRVGDFMLHELVSDNLEPSNPAYKRIFDLLLDTGENPYPAESWYLHHEDPQVSLTAINLTSNPYALSGHWREKHGIFITSEEDLLRKTVFEAVYTFKLRRVIQLLNETRRILSDLNDDELLAALERYQHLEKAKMALAGQLSYVIV